MGPVSDMGSRKSEGGCYAVCAAGGADSRDAGSRGHVVSARTLVPSGGAERGRGGVCVCSELLVSALGLFPKRVLIESRYDMDFSGTFFATSQFVRDVSRIALGETGHATKQANQSDEP